MTGGTFPPSEAIKISGRQSPDGLNGFKSTYSVPDDDLNAVTTPIEPENLAIRNAFRRDSTELKSYMRRKEEGGSTPIEEKKLTDQDSEDVSPARVAELRCKVSKMTPGEVAND